jgi:hypothetical protein
MHRSARFVVLGLAGLVLAGCASTGPRSSPAGHGASASSLGPSSSVPTTPTSPATATAASTGQLPPADSPLAGCVDPNPTAPKPVDTPIAQHFADGRVQTALTLDDGTFQALPAPANTEPRVRAALAFCNLLAGATANNFEVLGAAAEHGLSFGLGVVTVADSLLRPGPRGYLVGVQEQSVSLAPYRARLAWLAVIKPDIVSSCPPMSATTPSRPPAKTLPSYEILAIDANTGADGIVYSARTNNLCGSPGYRAPNVVPATEFVSLPWTLIRRGPGPQSATISYQSRSCDQPSGVTFAGTDKPVVIADRDNPALVSVDRERVLTTCGPPTTTQILLRSSTLATNLPARLVPAPVGAQDLLS